MLKKLKRDKKIYALGASTKGNVILQMCKLNNKIIKGVYDINPYKYGRYSWFKNTYNKDEKKSLKIIQIICYC